MPGPEPTTGEGGRPAVLTAEATESMLRSAQTGAAQEISAACLRWLQGGPPPDDVERFKILTVLFVCAQVSASALDETDIVERLIATAERWGSVPARATAHASRALTSASRGQGVLAVPDISRAAALLDLPPEDGRPAVPSDGFPQGHLRRLACNMTALALMRVGIHDQALHWIHRFRQVDPPVVDGSAAAFLAGFNEAWIQLMTAVDLDLDPGAPAGASTDRYREAARSFGRSVRGQPLEDLFVASAAPLGAAAAILAGHPATDAAVDELSAAVRPDHRAICALAIARVQAGRDDPRAALRALDTALHELPPDHSFRSIALRLAEERAHLALLRAPEPDRSAHRQLVEVLLADRLRERGAYRAAYERGLAGERQRLALLADRERTRVDELTGLATRAVLVDAVEAALVRAAEPGGRAVVVFVDLDGFKTVNDSRSHRAGDTVLRLFGEQVLTVLQEHDRAVRYGGDEFVLVLLDRPVDDVRAALADLSTRLAGLCEAHPEVGVPVTFSAGVVAVDPTATADDLVVAADVAMFAAKHTGADTAVGRLGT